MWDVVFVSNADKLVLPHAGQQCGVAERGPNMLMKTEAFNVSSVKRLAGCSKHLSFLPAAPNGNYMASSLQGVKGRKQETRKGKAGGRRTRVETSE